LLAGFLLPSAVCEGGVFSKFLQGNTAATKLDVALLRFELNVRDNLFASRKTFKEQYPLITGVFAVPTYQQASYPKGEHILCKFTINDTEAFFALAENERKALLKECVALVKDQTSTLSYEDSYMRTRKLKTDRFDLIDLAVEMDFGAGSGYYRIKEHTGFAVFAYKQLCYSPIYLSARSLGDLKKKDQGFPYDCDAYQAD
jgi:hypothetical protein